MGVPKISVIIPVYKDWKRLQLCIDALSKQSFDNNAYEIIVINNDPSTSAPDFFRCPRNLSVHHENIPGSYASRNRGLLLARGEVVAFTDSDCIPDVDWLANGMKLLDEGFDMIGGRIDIFKGNHSDSNWAYKFEKNFSFDQKSNVLINKSSVTANLIVKRNVFASVGAFRQDLYSGGDVLWTSLATSSGFKLAYGDNVIVKHPSRSSITALVEKKKRLSGGFYKKEYSKYKFIQKVKYGIWALLPPVSILQNKDMSKRDKTYLFFIKWYYEFSGYKELLLLNMKIKTFIRN